MIRLPNLLVHVCSAILLNRMGSLLFTCKLTAMTQFVDKIVCKNDVAMELPYIAVMECTEIWYLKDLLRKC